VVIPVVLALRISPGCRNVPQQLRDDLLLWVRELCDGIMIMTTVAESNLTDPFD